MSCLGSVAGRQFEVVTPFELLGMVGIVLGAVESVALVFVGLVAELQTAAQLGLLVVAVTSPEHWALVAFVPLVLELRRAGHSPPVVLRLAQLSVVTDG